MPPESKTTAWIIGHAATLLNLDAVGYRSNDGEVADSTWADACSGTIRTKLVSERWANLEEIINVPWDRPGHRQEAAVRPMGERRERKPELDEAPLSCRLLKRDRRREYARRDAVMSGGTDGRRNSPHEKEDDEERAKRQRTEKKAELEMEVSNVADDQRQPKDSGLAT